jgi:cbb3-type cytochrome oxidase subunit 3
MRLSDVMSHSGLVLFAEIAMILFIVVFVAIVIRVFTARRKDMDRNARLPLEDDERPAKEKQDE